MARDIEIRSIAQEERIFVTDEQLAKAIVEYRGNLSAIARALKVSRTTVVHRIRSRTDLVEALSDTKEGIKDMAEDQLIAAIEAGEPWAIQFFLARVARERGYGVQPVLLSVGDPLSVESTQESRLRQLSVEQLERIENIIEGTVIEHD